MVDRRKGVQVEGLQLSVFVEEQENNPSSRVNLKRSPDDLVAAPRPTPTTPSTIRTQLGPKRLTCSTRKGRKNRVSILSSNRNCLPCPNQASLFRLRDDAHKSEGRRETGQTWSWQTKRPTKATFHHRGKLKKVKKGLSNDVRGTGLNGEVGTLAPVRS